MGSSGVSKGDLSGRLGKTQKSNAKNLPKISTRTSGDRSPSRSAREVRFVELVPESDLPLKGIALMGHAGWSQ